MILQFRETSASDFLFFILFLCEGHKTNLMDMSRWDKQAQKKDRPGG